MRVKITGLNGYIGTQLSDLLQNRGYEVSAIDRKLLYGSISELANEIKKADVIINLAGANILQRWTKTTRLKIYNSRVETTRNLVQAIKILPSEDQAKTFISASAIGIYKSGETHNETSKSYEGGFIGNLVNDWESQLKDLPPTIRLSIFRVGIVLGKESKTIKNLMLPFKLGLGGSIASGKQAFPFIHETDAINAFEWVIRSNHLSGIFNLVAPEKITNQQFTRAVAKQLKRPAFLSVPSFILKLFLGKAASILLKSPIIEPAALPEKGFKYKFPTIDSSLKDILN